MAIKNAQEAATSMKVNSEQERVALRSIIARGGDAESWKECPCGWFYIGACCPDKLCKEWKKANGGKKIIKLYAHDSGENAYDEGKKLGMDFDACRQLEHWAYELEFDVEVDLETGKTNLLAVDGRKIFPVKG